MDEGVVEAGVHEEAVRVVGYQPMVPPDLKLAAVVVGWESLLARLLGGLPGGSDSAHWHLSLSGTFSFRSDDRALFRGPVLSWTFHPWKAPIPLKIKIFVW
jgi:hypothetical protein